jgi:heme/copper-type cytochrome/quinol oxidase subunit 1
MTQQHQEHTRSERVGPSETYDDDRTTLSDRSTLPRTDRVDPSYRGFKGGAAFFGWIVAIGLIALLTGIVGALAAAADYALTIDWNNSAGTIGIASAVVLLVILAIAYYNGGYVAGRLARFDGARQGFGVWVIGVVVTAVVAGLAALAGSQYDVLNRVNLPSVPIDNRTLTTGGVAVLIAAVVITLLAALIGGIAGQRYHKRIDTSVD